MSDAGGHLSDRLPDGLLVVPSGGGESLGPAEINFRAAWGEGRVNVFDQIVQPGTLVAAHRHSVETQAAYVVAGTIAFWVDGKEAVASAGDLVVRPVGTVHSLWNPTDEASRMLEITTPAEEFERFQLELRELVRSGAGVEELGKLAESYGTFMALDVTAELCERHGVRLSAGYSPSEEG